MVQGGTLTKRFRVAPLTFKLEEKRALEGQLYLTRIGETLVFHKKERKSSMI